MFVYCIENKLNGKKYIGKTVEKITRRFNRHKYKAKSNDRNHLHNAINKYGEENFVIYEIDKAENEQELNEKEMLWIKKYDTKNNGYNETDGGEGSSGRILSENTRKKISVSLSKKLEENSDYKEKISIATKKGMENWWNNLTEEEKIEHKEKLKNRPKKPRRPWKLTEKTKKLMSMSKKGKKRKPLTDEHKENIRKAKEKNKEKYMGDNNPMSKSENREKQRMGCLGRKKMYREDDSWYWGRV